MLFCRNYLTEYISQLLSGIHIGWFDLICFEFILYIMAIKFYFFCSLMVTLALLLYVVQPDYHNRVELKYSLADLSV